MSEVRTVATEALTRVLTRRIRLADCLRERESALDGRDRALARELCFGVMRWLPRLEFFAGVLLRRALRERDRDVHALLLLGLYQLEYTRIPPHAAVAETVGVADRLGKGWARGLVNGVLRTYLRDRESLARAAAESPEARHAHPGWLVERIADAWPERWRAVLAANNERAPMTLRVNRRRSDRDRYAARLAGIGLAARPTPHAASGLVLEHPVDVASLPGFADGDVSVQDPAAQLAADLLAAGPGDRVLDACAAPGGKTAHVLERAPEIGHLLALDRNPARLRRLRENLDRLGLAAELRAADATRPEEWWDGNPFDRVLLDAPCTATGVIRRQPDVKFLRRDADVERACALQSSLLEALWPLLARSGTLVYATCSVLPQENADRIVRFLDRHPDAEPRAMDGPWGSTSIAGRQILPGDDGMDGFFYAVLEKR